MVPARELSRCVRVSICKKRCITRLSQAGIGEGVEQGLRMDGVSVGGRPLYVRLTSATALYSAGARLELSTVTLFTIMPVPWIVPVYWAGTYRH